MAEELKEYICLKQSAEHEIVIKKSRFICRLIPVTTEQQAGEELAMVKKKHYNAAHNCSAMVLGQGSSFVRSSDDGEPQGTAGLPMLEVLVKSGVTNLLAVVTRYFGGTLLGAGGLVRAYSQSVAQTLKLAQLKKMIPAAELAFCIDYADYSKLQSLANEFGATVEAEFTEKVNAVVTLRQECFERAAGKINEAFLGAKVYELKRRCYISTPV